MCRLFGFRSSVESHVHQSLVAAENALIRQSEKHPDGWGVAYYVHAYPHLFRSAERAMGSGLFREVSGVVATYTLLAHIRRATVGDVTLLNCHPFQFANWVFAHNGEVGGFAESADVRAALRDEVDERFRPYILGTTDSEICFYVFLSLLGRRVDGIHSRGVDIGVASDCMRTAADRIRAVGQRVGGKPSVLTFIATNGNLMVGYREGRELFFSTYKTRCSERDTCSAFDAERCETEVPQGKLVKHLVLASEHIAENPNVWRPVGEATAVGVDWGMRLFVGG
ncbi:MAG: class II glutamine amidotransferase [Deltaproteobacteria bacterium]|nr:class II glutamine amidotransferase [Deltaproteobacteria bacterium]